MIPATPNIMRSVDEYLEYLKGKRAWGAPPYQVILHRLDDEGGIVNIPITSRVYPSLEAVLDEYYESQALMLRGGQYYWRTVIDADGESMILGEPLVEEVA